MFIAGSVPVSQSCRDSSRLPKPLSDIIPTGQNSFQTKPLPDKTLPEIAQAGNPYRKSLPEITPTGKNPTRPTLL